MTASELLVEKTEENQTRKLLAELRECLEKEATADGKVALENAIKELEKKYLA